MDSYEFYRLHGSFGDELANEPPLEPLEQETWKPKPDEVYPICLTDLIEEDDDLENDSYHWEDDDEY